MDDFRSAFNIVKRKSRIQYIHPSNEYKQSINFITSKEPVENDDIFVNIDNIIDRLRHINTWKLYRIAFVLPDSITYRYYKSFNIDDLRNIILKDIPLWKLCYVKQIYVQDYGTY